MDWFSQLGFFTIILISCGIVFFKYIFQLPANRLGFAENGGSFSLIRLKVIQRFITLSVVTIFSRLLFKIEIFRINHLIGFVFLVSVVYFILKNNYD